MNSEQKKALILLKAIIFHYHNGLSEHEEAMLKETAQHIQGEEELIWVKSFIEQEAYTAFDRARAFLNEVVSPLDTDTKIEYLSAVWEAMHAKGFISEIEATAILKFAKDWQVQKELMQFVRKRVTAN